jgi:hypothetical protein
VKRLLGGCSRGKRLCIGAEYYILFEDLHYDKIVIRLRGLRLGENLIEDEFIEIISICETSFPPSHTRKAVCIKKTSESMLFRKAIGVACENLTKQV